MAEANDAAVYEARRHQSGSSQILDNIVSISNCASIGHYVEKYGG